MQSRDRRVATHPLPSCNHSHVDFGALGLSAGYPTYAFGFGNSYFIAFDSNIPEDTIQAAWVEQGCPKGDDKDLPPPIAQFIVASVLGDQPRVDAATSF